jgi:glycosyltransferase involved in cell wall biosynthesis
MKQLWFGIFSILLCASVQAKQTVCLNMIVKDESQVIKRCLDSVIPIIDYWVIVDTGSKDGTQDIIKKHLKGIPGKLYQRRWKNFGENRSEAYELAKGKADYILFMDADDILKFEGEMALPKLTKDLYHMWRGPEGHSYIKPQIVKASLPWKWVGVTHEYLDSPLAYSSDTLTNIKYVSCDGGARSQDPKKFYKNIALLEEGLKQEPNNVRYVFYLAESYHDARENGKSLEWYQKRIAMGGWPEEVFWSHYRIASLMEELELAPNLVIEAYKNAHQYRPHRVEPIYSLADLYNRQGDHAKAYDLIQLYQSLPQPPEKDYLFNSDWMREYGLSFQRSLSAYYLGRYQESLDLCDQILAIKNLSEGWVELVKSNRKFPLQKLEVSLASQMGNK